MVEPNPPTPPASDLWSLDVLFLHAADGEGIAGIFNKFPGDLCRWKDLQQLKGDLARSKEVRIVATMENMEVINYVLASADRHSLKVQLGDPCLVAKDERDPSVILERMNRGYRGAIREGCWRGAEYIDRITYRLASRLRAHDAMESAHERVADHSSLMRLAELHPAWPAASLPENGDMLAAARVLVMLRDPRYFRTSEAVGLRRLYRWFGLYPSADSSQLCWLRRESLREAWTPRGRLGDSPLPLWLWEPLQQKNGELRASQRYLKLVASYWLWQIYGHPEFRPGRDLLSSPDEVARLAEKTNRQGARVWE